MENQNHQLPPSEAEGFWTDGVDARQSATGDQPGTDLQITEDRSASPGRAPAAAGTVAMTGPAGSGVEEEQTLEDLLALRAKALRSNAGFAVAQGEALLDERFPGWRAYARQEDVAVEGDAGDRMELTPAEVARAFPGTKAQAPAVGSGLEDDMERARRHAIVTAPAVDQADGSGAEDLSATYARCAAGLEARTMTVEDVRAALERALRSPAVAGYRLNLSRVIELDNRRNEAVHDLAVAAIALAEGRKAPSGGCYECLLRPGKHSALCTVGRVLAASEALCQAENAYRKEMLLDGEEGAAKARPEGAPAGDGIHLCGPKMSVTAVGEDGMMRLACPECGAMNDACDYEYLESNAVRSAGLRPNQMVQARGASRPVLYTHRCAKGGAR